MAYDTVRQYFQYSPSRHHSFPTELSNRIIDMKLNYSMTVVTLLAAIPSILADPYPVSLDHTR